MHTIAKAQKTFLFTIVDLSKASATFTPKRSALQSRQEKLGPFEAAKRRLAQHSRHIKGVPHLAVHDQCMWHNWYVPHFTAITGAFVALMHE